MNLDDRRGIDDDYNMTMNVSTAARRSPIANSLGGGRN